MTKFASHHLLLYVVYMCQKSLNFIYAFKCYQQNVSGFTLAGPPCIVNTVVHLCNVAGCGKVEKSLTSALQRAWPVHICCTIGHQLSPWNVNYEERPVIHDYDFVADACTRNCVKSAFFHEIVNFPLYLSIHCSLKMLYCQCPTVASAKLKFSFSALTLLVRWQERPLACE